MFLCIEARTIKNKPEQGRELTCKQMRGDATSLRAAMMQQQDGEWYANPPSCGPGLVRELADDDAKESSAGITRGEVRC